MAKPGKSRPPAAPSDDDAELFRQAIGPVREFSATPAPIARPRPPPRARQREADESAALQQSREQPFAVEAADLLHYRRPEVAPRVLKRLRRGQYAVQDEIDLHGLAAADAERLLREFLRDARARHRCCVRIVHGKGLHSQGAMPVLKQRVEQLLAQRREVLAFASAPPALGGAGAVLVLLARPRPGESVTGARRPGDAAD